MTQKRRKGNPITGLKRQIIGASRHSKFDQGLVERVLSQAAEGCLGNNLVSVQGTKEARELYNLHSQVMGEVNKLACYLRLNISPNGILFVEHTPEHRVEDLVVRHFRYRFPTYTIVMGSRRGIFVGDKEGIVRLNEPLGLVLDRLQEERGVDPILKELKETDDEIWEAFYQSQFVKQRENPRLFRRQVPGKFLKMESFQIERKVSRGKGLEGFFEERSGPKGD